ncbi:MAG: AAA family ATPase [Synechococcus sp.]|nr:AAA family ATPase [Synechococcus sp.]
MADLREIRILGYRGFQAEKAVPFAVPDGAVGSGLTYLVGSNNAGKSSVLECLTAASRSQPPSFTEGRRNKAAGDKVFIELVNTDGGTKKLSSVPTGGSETFWENQSIDPASSRFFILPSRRQFSSLFGKSELNREQYASQRQFNAQRGESIQFEQRLINIQSNREQFDKLLSEVVSPVPEWYIDQNDSGQYYLKFKSGMNYHNSDGMGEGLVSLFVLVDAFYDSRPGDIIVIDEPELSLHPQYQRRLSGLITKYSADRQVIVATHSPLMLDWRAVVNGASVVRVFQKDCSSQVASLSNESKRRLRGLLADRNNPHVFGLDASEVFFLEDGIILLEGQEDVVFLREVIVQLRMDFRPNVFGWGVGGADKMNVIAQMLSELGYSNVVGILDNDKPDVCNRLASDFPDYRFFCIPADDIRTKRARPALGGKMGLLDEKGLIRPDHFRKTYELLARVKRLVK